MKSQSLLLAALLLVAGCRAPSGEMVPAVPWETPDEALRVLRERSATIESTSATGAITLRRSGESVRLDVAMVSQPPDRLRLRAWKLGRAVFDLTLTPEALWLLTPDDPSLRERARSGGLDAAKLARSWATFSGKLFDHPDLAVKETERGLELSAPVDEANVRAFVEARALTPRRYELRDRDGAVRFTLQLSNYRLVDGIPYPFRYDAESETGTIRIDLREVELNGELPPAAFDPPRRAEKVQ